MAYGPDWFSVMVSYSDTLAFGGAGDGVLIHSFAYAVDLVLYNVPMLLLSVMRLRKSRKWRYFSNLSGMIACR